ncbi:hypothetical protein HaLaN_03958 [Haematococcus lacustris]|uniref:F-box domain-containing protein n=1 Tax=Haematococcus lacustris TaxID=44745 RepID=A0A699YQ83_HAELA|nr:hypothetical protein HaLaN_03958 [Haematococcus lacustris]
MPQRNATLLDTLESVSGVSHIIYSYLLRDGRRPCRLVCKRLRTVIDGNITHVSIRLDQASAVEDSIERFARSSLRPNVLSLEGPHGSGRAEVASELSSALSAPSRKHFAALHAVRELRLHQVPAPLHLSMALAVNFRHLQNLSFAFCEVHHRSCEAWERMEQLSSLTLYFIQRRPVGTTAATAAPRLGGLQLIRGLTSLQLNDVEVDESSLAACTQLTRLECPNSFPGLAQLTQLQHVSLHTVGSLSTITELASLPHLARLELGSCVSTDQLGSSQRYLFPSLTYLEITSINASLLAALDCPQLQHLWFIIDFESDKCLCVDSVPSLHACVGSLLKHCGYVRLSCGPGVTLTEAMEALAPWQPSAAALSSSCDGMGLMLDGEKKISASHLELLPTGLQELSFMGCTLLPGALHPVATRLTQLKMLNLHDACQCSEEDLQLLASQSVQGRRLTVQFDSPSRKVFASSLQCLSDMAGQWGGRPGPRFQVF